MSKKRRDKPVVSAKDALTPDYATAVVEKVIPDLHVEEWLWALYRSAKTAAENFRKQRDEARAELALWKATSKVRHISKKLVHESPVNKI